MITSPVVEVNYQDQEIVNTNILDWGWFAFHEISQDAAKLICVEKEGQLWFKAIFDVDPIADSSRVIKTTFSTKEAMWEAMTSNHDRGISFLGIPVYWFDSGEFVLSVDTPYPG